MKGTILLREEDVRKVLDLDAAIEAVEEGYRQYGLGRIQSPPWRDVSFDGKDIPHGAGPGIVQAMAYNEQEQIAVIKHFYSFRNSGSSRLHLIDAKNERILAVMEAGFESLMRTGAAGAVAAKYLARRRAPILGVIGTGNQARAQVRFASHAVEVGKVLAWSIDPMGKRMDFARDVQSATMIEVRLVDSPREVAESSDLLITATRSTTPIVEGEWLKAGTHVTSMGADDPHKVELASSALARADKLVIDYEKACETAQLRKPVQNGEVCIYGTISEVVAGIKPGRENDDEITVFHSTGMTAQDVTLALLVYRRAEEKGIGLDIREEFGIALD